MVGTSDRPEFNKLSGQIALRSRKIPTAPVQWRKESEELLEHVLCVMSLASATMLRAPVTEHHSVVSRMFRTFDFG